MFYDTLIVVICWVGAIYALVREPFLNCATMRDFQSQYFAAVVGERRLPMVVGCILHPVDRGTSRVKVSLWYPGVHLEE